MSTKPTGDPASHRRLPSSLATCFCGPPMRGTVCALDPGWYPRRHTTPLRLPEPVANVIAQGLRNDFLEGRTRVPKGIVIMIGLAGLVVAAISRDASAYYHGGHYYRYRHHGVYYPYRYHGMYFHHR